MYFVPITRGLPVFGSTAATTWLWSMTISPGFVGQGIVTGPIIPLHMLLGAVVGWGLLSPLAKAKGWAPGAVEDWDHGSRAWISWIAVSALVADAMVNLVAITYRSVFGPCWRLFTAARATTKARYQRMLSREIDDRDSSLDESTEPLLGHSTAEAIGAIRSKGRTWTVTAVIGTSFVVALIACIIGVRSIFTSFRWWYVLSAVVLALPMSVISIRCLAESDFNPQTTLGTKLR